MCIYVDARVCIYHRSGGVSGLFSCFLFLPLSRLELPAASAAAAAASAAAEHVDIDSY